MILVNSVKTMSAALRSILAASTEELRARAEGHEPYEGGKLCIESMWAMLDRNPDTFGRFAATVLRARQYQIELINTGE